MSANDTANLSFKDWDKTAITGMTGSQSLAGNPDREALPPRQAPKGRALKNAFPAWRLGTS